MDLRGKIQVRGLRNNNPGNIVKSNENWQGKVPHSQNSDTRFEQFISMEYGMRALMININTYYHKHKLNTIEKIIHRWAPPHENDTIKYVNGVAKSLGITSKQVFELNKKAFITLAKAITEKENGTNNSKIIADSLYETAYEMAALSEKKK